MNSEERLRKYYIEEHNKGNNISIYANSIQCTKDIQEILNRLEEARKQLNEFQYCAPLFHWEDFKKSMIKTLGGNNESN